MPHIPDHISEAVRREYSAPVDDAVRERHVAAIAQAARETDAVSVPARRHGRRRAGTALAAGLALFAAPAALAAAGVDLPEPARAPFDAVGIELPNQDSQDKPEPPRRAIPARTAADPTPAAPRGGTPKPAPAPAGDDKRGTRRSEERNKGRRGDEASEGRRQGGERRSDAAERERTPKPRPVKPVTPPSRGRSSEAPGRNTPKAVTPRTPKGTTRPQPQRKPAETKAPRARTVPLPAPPAEPPKKKERAET